MTDEQDITLLMHTKHNEASYDFHKFAQAVWDHLPNAVFIRAVHYKESAREYTIVLGGGADVNDIDEFFPNDLDIELKKD